jgi:HPt (histidine-containing phosphotransfer) domain-containing protein
LTPPATRLAHSIKAVAGNLGAGRLEEEAGKLEADLRETHANLDEQLKRFEAELDSTIRAISEAGIGDEPEPKSPREGGSLSRAEGLERIHELVSHLDSRNPDPATEALESLQDFNWTSSQRVELHQIGQALSNYRFADTRSMVEKLKLAINKGEESG